MGYTTNARTRQTRTNPIRINGTPTQTKYSSDVSLRGMAFGALRYEISRGLMHLPSSNAVPIVRIARVCTKRHKTDRGAPLLSLRSRKKKLHCWSKPRIMQLARPGSPTSTLLAKHHAP